MKTMARVLGVAWLFFVMVGTAFGYSTQGTNTLISRLFDRVSAPVGDPITVTVSFTNLESNALRGFYYSEHIPDGLSVNTTSVRINGVDVPDYLVEWSLSGDVYPGYKTYRWILETPTAFSENNPINNTFGLEIVYTATSSQAGTFYFDQFNWVGYYPAAAIGSRDAFGYSEDADKQPISFKLTVSGTVTVGLSGLSGVSMSGLPGSPVTGADGSYTGLVDSGWSGTVTPSLTGYTFSPANRTYTNVLANQTAQDYNATAITYTISGNAGVGGATLSYTDVTAKTSTADGSGNYSFSVSYSWSGTVTPSLAGYTFSPTNRSYTNVLANQTAQNYTATAITYTISGNAGVGGATLSYTDVTAKTATADGSGNYSFSVSYNWSGMVTPSLAGYTFSPTSRSYTSVLANQTAQDYNATAITYTISGNAGVGGATLSYTDVTAKTATADGSGNYSFSVSYNWSGTVTPSLTGYTFSPTNRTYTNVLSNQIAQDYTATAITYTISGNAGVGGATLSYTDVTAKTATADGSGNYSFSVSYSWSGTVTPSKAGYEFSPISRSYTNVLSNQTNQNYTGTKSITRGKVDQEIVKLKTGTSTAQQVKDMIDLYMEIP